MQDPWAGFSETPTAQGDPWAGFGDTATATAEAPGPVYTNTPQAGKYSGAGSGDDPTRLLESAVRGAEMSTGSAIDWIGSTGERLLNAAFPGKLTRAEIERRNKGAGSVGRDLTAYAEKEHPPATDTAGKIAEGIGGVVPYAVTETLSGGAATPLVLGTIAGQHISQQYDEALKATGSDVAATEAAIANIPGAAAMVLPFWKVFGKMAAESPATGDLIKEGLKGVLSGVVGMGSARVLGDMVHEQVTGEDREILKNALEGVAVDAPLFGFLEGVAGVTGRVAEGEKVLGTPGAEAIEAPAEKAGGGQAAPEIQPENVQPSQVQAPIEPAAPATEGQMAGSPAESATKLEETLSDFQARAVEKYPDASPAVAEYRLAKDEGLPASEDAMTIDESVGERMREGQGRGEAQGAIADEEAAKSRELLGAEAPPESELPPAEPTEAEPPLLEPEAKPTSAKNSVVDRERAERGLPPVEEEASHEWGPVWDEAKTALEKDPGLADKIIEGRTSEGISRDTRQAALTRVQVETQNEHAKLRDALLHAQEAGDTETVAALEERKSAVSDRLLQVYNAQKREGSESGRALNIRRLMANEDFSLAAMETEVRIAKGGAKLSPEEMLRIEKLSERISAAERAMDEFDASRALKKETTRATEKRGRILDFVSAQADAARARIKARGPRAMAGLDPVDAADRVLIGVEYLAKDISKLADWSAAMVKEFGEAIRPHLASLFEDSKAAYAKMQNQEPKQRAQETRMRGQIEKVSGKIAAQDFEPEPKREPVPLTPEGVKLKANLEEVRREYMRELQRHRFENRTKGQVARDAAKEALNLPKALMTAYDFSAVLRQGAVFSLGHPIETAKSLPSMFAATFSERRALEIDIELRHRQGADVGERAGLELTRHGDDIGKHEEAIRSQWSDKIPGIKASNRAFITFLNMQRATAFDAMVKAHPGELRPEEAKALASFVNIATGRGDPGKFAAAVSAASNVLWSPRLLLSRFQLLAGQPLYKGTAATRKAIATQYARALVGVGAVYAMAKLAGAEVETDPRSSDFGKVRFGNTRIDPLAGLSQVTVLLDRIVSGETKTGSGDVQPLRGPDLKYGHANEFDVMARFVRSKLSPTLGIPINMIAGQNAVGEPVTPTSTAKDLLVPLSFQDIAKAMEEQGVPAGVAMGILSTFGMGLQSYEPKKSGWKSLSKAK